jgi:hypothetical protein
MLAPLAHARPLERRPAASDHANRIAAGMGVDAEESVAGHRPYVRQLRRRRNAALEALLTMVAAGRALGYSKSP